MTGHKV